MAKKHYPVVKSFPLSEASPSTGAPRRIVDVGACLSQANRRLYRYGRYYNVKIDLEADSNTQFDVFALRDDWAVQKGFQLAYAAYQRATEDERAHMSENQIARWEDFRVNHNLTAGVVGPVLSETGNDTVIVGQGEHAFTAVVDATGNNHTFVWTGTGASVYNVLEEYDKAGNAQAHPHSLVAGNSIPYEDLESDVDGLQANNLEAFGDNPPYDRDGVNSGDPFVKIATLVSNSPNAQKLSTGFFDAPCGLVLIVQNNTAGSPIYSDISGRYSLTVKGGDYKGVHAPSMLE